MARFRPCSLFCCREVVKDFAQKIKNKGLTDFAQKTGVWLQILRDPKSKITRATSHPQPRKIMALVMEILTLLHDLNLLVTMEKPQLRSLDIF